MKYKVATGIVSLLLLSSLLVFSSKVQTANAESVFFDDFDDGDITDWAVTTSGDAIFDVSTNTSVSSPYSVHLKSLSDYRAMGVSPSYSLDLTANYTVSFYFRIPHTNNHWFEVFNNHQIYLVIDSNDDLKCYNGTSYLISELATNQWYNIEIEAYPSLSSYDVYLNGTFERLCPMWIHTGLENNFRIGDRADGSSDKGEAYWDNFTIRQGRHDIAVIDAIPHKTVACQCWYADWGVKINVTVENQGDFTESFNVTAYANTTIIQTQNVTLTSGNSTIITFVWNITDFKGVYNITATASTVQGESETTDNTFIDGTVRVTIAGDIAEPFGWVNILDILYLAVHFGTDPADQKWDPIADIDNNGIVGILDILIIAVNFGETV